MRAEHKREIRQLWFVADHYFKMAKRNKNSLTKNDLSTTIGNIAKICQCFNESKFGGSKRSIMLLNAHLASCAIRLYTIDEILGEHDTSNRWDVYDRLKKNGIGGALKESDIKDKLKIIDHFLLRHNTAHREKQPAGYNGWELTMEKALQKVKIQKLYENMELIIKSIKSDIISILNS